MNTDDNGGSVSEISSAVVESVVSTYYPGAVTAGNLARSRAQTAQSATTAAVGIAIAALSIADLKQQHVALRIFACMALVLWASASVFYLSAVGRPVDCDDGLAGANSESEVVRIILRRAKSEKDAVDKRQHAAHVFSVMALMLTVVTVVIYLFE